MNHNASFGMYPGIDSNNMFLPAVLTIAFLYSGIKAIESILARKKRSFF